ncbi:MAG TPA: DNA replication and repair protein RecF [Blastocatellia bacterium]|nr:DNA replication and repair protein RecF [Blastocatellia bacterium]
MLLTRLEATGFRNLDGFAQFGAGLNIFYGDNAQGKTNWLEAIYVLGSTKSFRTSKLHECVRFDALQAVLRGNVVHGSVDKQIQLALTESSKELYVNGKREAVTRYLGNLDVFVFSLEEMEVIRGEPSERRRFLDRGIVTVTPGYLNQLAQYNHVLKQKNRLLSAAAESERPADFIAQVEAWNEELIEYGAALHQARTDYVERLNAVLAENDYGRAIFAAERLSVRYRSQLEGKGNLDNFSELFRERLGARLQAELSTGHALIGPHRDDLEILADAREVSRFGSAGQQRSALLLLDLAQVSIYNRVYEESPVLLIDDIDAELDRGRIEALISSLEGRAQTFVSTSRRAIANRYRERATVFAVEGGRARREPTNRWPGVDAVTAAGAAPAASDELERAVREIALERDEAHGPADDRGDYEQSSKASFN